MAKVKFEDRPTCSCGVKMKLVEYIGYYDTFRYWECGNCSLDEKIQNEDVKTDGVWRGGYA